MIERRLMLRRESVWRGASLSLLFRDSADLSTKLSGFGLRHLNHDGVLQIWYPSLLGDRTTTASMTKALIQSFPYVRAYHSFDGQYGIHYLAGLEPIGTLDGRTLTSRMPAAAKSD